MPGPRPSVWQSYWGMHELINHSLDLLRVLVSALSLSCGIQMILGDVWIKDDVTIEYTSSKTSVYAWSDQCDSSSAALGLKDFPLLWHHFSCSGRYTALMTAAGR